VSESQLKKLLASGETERVEFKEKLGESFYKTICAFANTRGGTILLGIGKKGEITGVEPSNKFLEDLTNRIVGKLSLYPEIATIDADEKRVIAVKVARAGFPISCEGRYYERVGNTTREISKEKLQALLLRSTPWDCLTCDFPWEEVDAETVGRFIRLATDKKRLADFSVNEPPEVILQKLELISDEKLTNGALLLFGKNPQKHFINLCVRVGRLKTETTIIDDKWARGNLFQQFEETLNILKQHIGVRYEIKDIERDDIWEYPIPALREALLNALVHRDCFDAANPIVIKVYDDHIWIFNPGRLPEGITIEQLKKPHRSFVRNPLVAKAFYLAGYIEQYGSGTTRMVEWMKKAGLPEPEYKDEMAGFSVYFYKDIYTEEDLKKVGLNERQIKAIMYVKAKGRITNREYWDLIGGMSRATMSRDLSDLTARGILRMVGVAKRQLYYVLNDAKMMHK
jgi:ATP-dependent DNA helicase RecG